MAMSFKSVLLPLILAAISLPAQVPLPVSAAVLATDVPVGNNQALRSQAEQLFVLGNQARAAQGLRPLQWDPALAAAALNHCARMAAEGPISHQYAGEPDLSQRAGRAGAHFSLIEENVAVGAYPAQIHQAWMNSHGHRENLLNPEVNRVGVAVVARGDDLYAVVDFGRAVSVLTPEQVEATVASLMRTNGVAAHGNSAGARLACAQDHGMPVSLDHMRPEFIMRWQDAALDRLPEALLERMATGKYHEAAVGSCPSQSADGTFTVYRVAVLLLKPVSGSSRAYLSSK
ncbi:MAG TPA: CAP domain-containing protein [Terracidiphilus sp.]|nr:CAP domain-containing protein [Terracidiphilus sp.]